MIIAVDAMGGDFAPQATVQGSIKALDKSNKKLDIILLGDEKRINNIFKSQFPKNIRIIHCVDEVTMNDNGSKILRSKPNSSMVKGIKLLRKYKLNIRFFPQNR